MSKILYALCSLLLFLSLTVAEDDLQYVNIDFSNDSEPDIYTVDCAVLMSPMIHDGEETMPLWAVLGFALTAATYDTPQYEEMNDFVGHLYEAFGECADMDMLSWLATLNGDEVTEEEET
ncbi:MAG: hypothetical protein OXT68_19165 [Chloroflexota bacterium]|nr:hypothetical protein [Chloroflexota bacterium]